MTHIVVDAAEAALIAQSDGGLQVRDPHGKLIGFVTPAPPEHEVERMMARFDEGPDGPLRSTAEVLERLRALDQP
ncbi:MAG TPA: hypothetical protein VMV69_21450 [Pirellulales bacterium]|nr:hypothetical protein [Pirellulales bacterium]